MRKVGEISDQYYVRLKIDGIEGLFGIMAKLRFVARLCWSHRTNGAEGPRPRRRDLDVPSWTWAGWEGEVEWSIAKEIDAITRDDLEEEVERPTAKEFDNMTSEGWEGEVERVVGNTIDTRISDLGKEGIKWVVGNTIDASISNFWEGEVGWSFPTETDHTAGDIWKGKAERSTAKEIDAIKNDRRQAVVNVLAGPSYLEYRHADWDPKWESNPISDEAMLAAEGRSFFRNPEAIVLTTFGLPGRHFKLESQATKSARWSYDGHGLKFSLSIYPGEPSELLERLLSGELELIWMMSTSFPRRVWCWMLRWVEGRASRVGLATIEGDDQQPFGRLGDPVQALRDGRSLLGEPRKYAVY